MIIEKEDGTYELEAETTVAIPYLQWYDKYNQARGKYTCLSKETQCEKSYKIVSASLYDFAYIPIEENYLFASDYDYNEETNEYTLSGDTITSLDVFDNYSYFY